MADPTRPVTGYPAQPTNGYPQPPLPQQQQPLNSTYYYPNNNQNYYHHALPPPPPRATLFRRMFTATIAAVMVLAIIFLLFDLILRPRVPTFSLSSLSLSNLNLSSTPSQISATWTSTWTISNPNDKLHVYYDEIESRILYRSSLLAINQLPPFDQTTKSQSNVTAKLVATSAYISPELNRELEGDRSKGSVKFDLQVLALVRFKSSGWRSRRRGLRAFCDNISVVDLVKGLNGNFSGESRRCEVII